MVSLMIGLIYFGQDYDQDGVMNINGALFICISNMTFQNVFAVITVSDYLEQFSFADRTWSIMWNVL